MAYAGRRTENAQERLAGLREAVLNSKVEIIDLMLDETNAMKAEDNVAETLSKYPDVVGMVGLWGYNGPAIRRSLAKLNKTDQVKIVCFDDEPETLEGIKDGSIFGSVAQQPFEYGYQSVSLISKLLKGDKSVIPPDKRVLIPTTIIQRDNLDQYKKSHEEILGGKK